MQLSNFLLPAGNLHALAYVFYRTKWTHVFSLMLVLCGIAGNLYAQPLGAYTIIRVEERTTTYEFPDSIINYPIVQRTALLQRYSRDSIVINVYTNSDIKRTTYHQQNGDFEDWMRRPYKTVIDKKMYKAYSASGTLLLSALHTVEYKSLYNTLKAHLGSTYEDLNVDYVQLTGTLKTELMAEGFIMTNLGGGTFQFVKDSVELWYNNTRKSNHMILRTTDGTLKYELLRDFRVNDLGQTVISNQVEKYPDPRFPDDCVLTVVQVHYPYYKMVSGIVREENAAEKDVQMDIYPIPADQLFTIELPESDEESQLTVYAADGAVKYLQTCSKETGMVEVAVSDWPAGMYIVHLKNSIQDLSQSIIVQH